MVSSRILFCLALGFAVPASSAVVEVGAPGSTLRSLYIYGDSEGAIAGHVIVEVSTPLNASVCRGGWIDKEDAQYAQVVQVLTTAKLTRSPVRIIADNARLFPGSSDRYCYIHVVGLL